MSPKPETAQVETTVGVLGKLKSGVATVGKTIAKPFAYLASNRWASGIGSLIVLLVLAFLGYMGYKKYYIKKCSNSS